jgi:hypothetical protein
MSAAHKTALDHRQGKSRGMRGMIALEGWRATNAFTVFRSMRIQKRMAARPFQRLRGNV